MTQFYRHLIFSIFSNLPHNYLQWKVIVLRMRVLWPTPEAHAVRALRWKHLPDRPVAVFCGIVSHYHSLVFLFTR